MAQDPPEAPRWRPGPVIVPPQRGHMGPRSQRVPCARNTLPTPRGYHLLFLQAPVTHCFSPQGSLTTLHGPLTALVIPACQQAFPLRQGAQEGRDQEGLVPTFLPQDEGHRTCSINQTDPSENETVTLQSPEFRNLLERGSKPFFPHDPEGNG